MSDLSETETSSGLRKLIDVKIIEDFVDTVGRTKELTYVQEKLSALANTAVLQYLKNPPPECKYPVEKVSGLSDELNKIAAKWTKTNDVLAMALGEGQVLMEEWREELQKAPTRPGDDGSKIFLEIASRDIEKANDLRKTLAPINAGWKEVIIDTLILVDPFIRDEQLTKDAKKILSAAMADGGKSPLSKKFVRDFSPQLTPV